MKKWLSVLGVILLVALLGMTVDYSPDNQGKMILKLGSIADAAGDLDYTFDGTDDNVQFQAALNALPATGGELVVVSATTINFSATVTRAIDNVTITGSGRGTYFAYDAGTALFTAGGNNWTFRDLRTDAGGLTMGATTGWSWLNVTINATYYTLRTPADGNATLGSATITTANITTNNAIDIIFADSGAFKTLTADNSEFSMSGYDKDGATYRELLTVYGGINDPYINYSLGFNISNTKSISFSDGGGVARTVITGDGNNIRYDSPQGTMLMQNNVAQNINMWGGSSGTSRSLVLSATAATNGLANDSATLNLRASYDADAGAGVTATDWAYTVLNDMVTAGAAPKSIVYEKINNVIARGLQNDNGVITNLFYTGAGVNSASYAAGVLNFNEATTIQTTGGGDISLSAGGFLIINSPLQMANTKSILSTYTAGDTWYIKVRNTNDATNKTAIQFLNTSTAGGTALMGFYGASPVAQQTKASHNNWAALSDVVSALVNLGLLDTP